MLAQVIEDIRTLAEEQGLRPLPVHFELVPAEAIYEVGAYGLPGRFSHWSHGKAYHRLKTEYDHGLSRIYELICNGNPCLAFLLENNDLLSQKVIIAHVFAHADFFGQNVYFRSTDREMAEKARLHADRIRKYEYDYGARTIEEFLDAVLSLRYHVDARGENAETSGTRWRNRGSGKTETRASDPRGGAGGKAETGTAHQRAGAGTKAGRARKSGPGTAADPADGLFRPAEDVSPPAKERFPATPTEDILGFIMRHARGLEDWQRDIIGMVRSEMLYFRPQIRTKITNEGWAAYWHKEILRQLSLTPAERLEFARLHSGLLARSKFHLNPYLLGLAIYEGIEKEHGRERLFEVRELNNDLSFIRNYLTEEVVKELDLYTVVRQEDYQEQRFVVGEKDWEKVKAEILTLLTNGGHPCVVVEDGDYQKNRELYLRHVYDGRPLDEKYAQETLRYIRRLWGRDVHLESRNGDSRYVMKATAEGFTRQTLAS